MAYIFTYIYVWHIYIKGACVYTHTQTHTHIWAKPKKLLVGKKQRNTRMLAGITTRGRETQGGKAFHAVICLFTAYGKE